MPGSPDHPVVLVLDDDPETRKTMRRFLEMYEYGAVEAATFDEALAILGTTHVFAVILDVRLPGKHTGIDLLGPIRSRAELAKIPILVMTGGVVNDQEARLVTRHRAHLFYKPEGFDTLLSFLDQLTGRDREY